MSQAAGDEDFRLRRLRFRLRWHLAAIDLVEGLRPVMCVHARLEIARKPIDAHVPFGLLRAMTTDAVLFEESFKRFGSANVACEAEADDDGRQCKS